MALVFYNAVNETLKRAGIVQGDVSSLSTASATASGVFTENSNIQHPVDLLIQMWQETTNEVFSLGLVPKVVATATITLAADTREYSLPDDFERVAGNSRKERVVRSSTAVWNMTPYPGGYLKMLADQNVASDWQGRPNHYAISPNDGALRVDSDPQTSEDGSVYHLAYEKTLSLTGTMATDAMPYSDTVTRSLVPVVTEFYKRAEEKEFDRDIFRTSLVRALTMVRTEAPRRRWGSRRGG